MPKCVIFVFSGTGNTAFIAGQVRKNLEENDVTTNIYNIDELYEIPNTSGYDYIGIGFPVYAFTIPTNVAEFIRDLPRAEKGQKAFVFATYASKALYAIQEAVDKLTMKDYKILRSRGFVMPSNYFISIISMLGKPFTDQETIDHFNGIKKPIKKYVGQILKGKKTVESEGHVFGKMASGFIGSMFKKYGAPNAAKKFYVNDFCTGCKLCAASCPVANIQMVDRKPEFLNRCISCCRCYNICPKKAIEHPDAPDKDIRYKAPGYKPPEINKV